MKRMTAAMLSLTVFLTVPASAQSPMTGRWLNHVRTLDDKVKAITTQLEQIPKSQWHSEQARRLKCEAAAAMAYLPTAMMIAEQGGPKREGNTEFFHLLLKGDRDEVFDLVYIYADETIVGTRIDRMPHGWMVTIIKETIIVNIPQTCFIIFHQRDPFVYKVSVLGDR
jgi:hypothetical protein